MPTCTFLYLHFKISFSTLLWFYLPVSHRIWSPSLSLTIRTCCFFTSFITMVTLWKQSCIMNTSRCHFCGMQNLSDAITWTEYSHRCIRTPSQALGMVTLSGAIYYTCFRLDKSFVAQLGATSNSSQILHAAQTVIVCLTLLVPIRLLKRSFGVNSVEPVWLRVSQLDSMETDRCKISGYTRVSDKQEVIWPVLLC